MNSKNVNEPFSYASCETEGAIKSSCDPFELIFPELQSMTSSYNSTPGTTRDIECSTKNNEVENSKPKQSLKEHTQTSNRNDLQRYVDEAFEAIAQQNAAAITAAGGCSKRTLSSSSSFTSNTSKSTRSSTNNKPPRTPERQRKALMAKTSNIPVIKHVKSFDLHKKQRHSTSSTSLPKTMSHDERRHEVSSIRRNSSNSEHDRVNVSAQESMKKLTLESLPKYDLEHMLLNRTNSYTNMSTSLNTSNRELQVIPSLSLSSSKSFSECDTSDIMDSYDQIHPNEQTGDKGTAETSFIVEDDEQYTIRTSEQDPSPFQLEIPDCHDLLDYLKLCMHAAHDQGCSAKHVNFPRRISQAELQQVVKTHELQNQILPRENFTQQGMLSDLVLQEVIRGAGKHGLIEVYLYSIRNRVIVLYQSSAEQQLKPVSSMNFIKKKKVTVFSPNKQVPSKKTMSQKIYGSFHNVYFQNQQNYIEQHVFRSLKELIYENPFLHLVFCGYSFGATLSTIGAKRFASKHPTTRISNVVFGSPVVCPYSSDFKLEAHSLSNLNVVRVELEGDEYCDLPAVSNISSDCCHVGHAIILSPVEASSKNMTKIMSRHPVEMKIFKFNKQRSSRRSSNNNTRRKSLSASSPVSSKKRKNLSHSIQKYHHCLRLLSCFSSNEDNDENKKVWKKVFFGEDVGDGVKGFNDEKRCLV